ncbi:MAG: hypothetical protein KDB07_01210 [Planctomycetes bacterium]|nr:hypothetical protein [Planctomycetota bacterium]
MKHLLILTLACLAALLALAPQPRAQSEEGDEDTGSDANANEEPEVRWKESRCVQVPLTWLVQSAYLPSRMLEDKQTIPIAEQVLEVSIVSDAESTDKPKEASNQRAPYHRQWRLAIKGNAEAAWNIPAEGGAAKLGDLELAVYYDELGRAFLQPRYAWKARPNLRDYLFIDANFNGRFDDELVDLMVRGTRGAFAFPFSKRMPLDDGIYRFEFSEKNNYPVLRYSKSDFLTKASAKLLQATMNRLRMNFGLFPAISDSEWNGHCEAHCKYMKTNDSFTHHEERDKPGFTAKGHVAGMSSIMTKGDMSASHAFYSLWDTPLHGFDVRSPYFSHSAFGYVKPYSVIRTMGLTHRPFAFTKPWAFPPNNAKNIPIEWPGKEMPEPRIDTDKYLGYPLTFYAQWGEVSQGEGVEPKRITRPRISEASARLLVWEGKAWKELKIQFTYNQESAPIALKSWGWVYHYILPEDKLSPNSLHRLEVNWKDDQGESQRFESCFTTGEDRGGHVWEASQQNDPKAKR